jgi:hypothetical protein
MATENTAPFAADDDFLAELLSGAPVEEVVEAPKATVAKGPVSDPEGDRYRLLCAAADACKAKGGTVLEQLATVQAISCRDFPRTH